MDLMEGKDPGLAVYDTDPFNAGAPLSRLADEFVTPTEAVYVRNHAPVPRVDPDTHRLRVDGRVTQPMELSLGDLADRFERVDVVAALCCAGNRRRELMEVADIPGETPWRADAVSNVRWSGWRLGDLLTAAGLSDEAAHVAFTGRDRIRHADGHIAGFGGSIPVTKAVAEEVVVADTMNGKPLPAVHGFPLRLVVPGYIGARSVKWLARIEARAEPSTNHYQRRAYRLFSPGTTADTVRWEQGMMLGELPVTSAICRPADGDHLPSRGVRFAGYALSGGARRIERVELTSDEGRTWTQATRTDATRRDRSDQWAWTLWQAELDLPPGRHRVAVRAVDASANTQPEQPAPLWNIKGYVNNAWHRITVTVG